MDWTAKQRALYQRMEGEITSFLMHFPNHPVKAVSYLENLLAEVEPVGGRLMLDIEVLLADARSYVQKPNKSIAEQIQNGAIRIKNEVREL